ncbi:MAG: AMP-binding protein, partial [Aeromicrobium sp.]
MSSLSQDAGPITQALLEETISANFARAVADHGDREALVDRGNRRRWTYTELDRDVEACALGLVAFGVTKGDRVGIWAPNCPEWVLVQYATARLGAILVNINPAYRSHELAYVLKQSGMRTIVAVPEFKGSSYADMIDEVRGDCPDLVDVVLIGEASWDDLMASGASIDPAPLKELESTLSADDPINIQYTSGTTGFPKG